MPTPKRILITRSRHQTSVLAAQLASLGAEPILIPTITLAPPAAYTPLDHALAHLHTFDWLLFTSANAAQAFTDRAQVLAESHTSPHPASPPTRVAQPLAQHTKGWGPEPVRSTTSERPTQPRIAAIGPATAQALTTLQLPPDLIPPQAIAESFAEALLPHISPGRTRILLIRAGQARNILPDTLTAAGAEVTIAPAYRNLIPQESIPLLQTLFRSPETWPDAITFTSSSTAQNLLTLLEAAHLQLPPDGAHGRTILRASIGPITSATLRDLGHPPHLEAPEANIPSLVRSLAHHLDLKTP